MRAPDHLFEAIEIGIVSNDGALATGAIPIPQIEGLSAFLNSSPRPAERSAMPFLRDQRIDGSTDGESRIADADLVVTATSRTQAFNATRARLISVAGIIDFLVENFTTPQTPENGQFEVAIAYFTDALDVVDIRKI